MLNNDFNENIVIDYKNEKGNFCIFNCNKVDKVTYSHDLNIVIFIKINIS